MIDELETRPVPEKTELRGIAPDRPPLLESADAERCSDFRSWLDDPE